ncbi:putative WD repeat-containing protein C3H5.08c [Vitis vinifera]|uniref:Putative WD repeat-containing protein C3H5.08c n=1 Tax=Vitis vinifera TaxID=29760 RepID=A0A438HX66_VITVI|nr:putative WD repeat-containing protein C3H5.08c [Vitis vinifera]
MDAASLSDSGSDCNDNPNSSSGFNNYASRAFQYDVWAGSPGSVKERRNKFLNWMGLSLDRFSHDNSVDVCSDSLGGGVDRVRESSGAVLRTLGFEDEFCSSRSSMSCWSNEQDESGLQEKFVCRIGNLDVGAEFDVDEMGEGSEQVMQREIEEASNPVGAAKRVKKGWLSRLRSMSCIMDRHGEIHNLTTNDTNPIPGARIQRVRVRQCRKQMKELSALYKGQDIQAHEGSILTMKFSPDGKYLASAGEDGIVRIWQVVEDERSNDHDIPEIDPMCIYFTVNHLSELTPLFAEKEKLSKLRSLRKTSDSACVIFPPKVFRIVEKPLHEFHGHSSEILDLSWSNNNYLLSSSIDKTVRLWRVGCDHCLKIFSHNNYGGYLPLCVFLPNMFFGYWGIDHVTCVQFNPVDDNYFISGSIDGKVRIWAIPGCQVVDWTDIREMVTAVCYRPDGQGGIVGSMTGTCRFYNVSDNHLQLESQMCLHGKKKSLCKRITGFQFSPRDPSTASVMQETRLMKESLLSPNQKALGAFEHFPTNASVAIPWCGMKYGNPENGWQFHALDESSPNTLPFPSPASFSLSQEFFSESFPKGSATWPEEKLPTSSLVSVPSKIRKSEHKFLKACQSTSSSHAWGLVIVTAGWDGRIRISVDPSQISGVPYSRLVATVPWLYCNEAWNQLVAEGPVWFHFPLIGLILSALRAKLHISELPVDPISSCILAALSPGGSCLVLLAPNLPTLLLAW